ncbi:N-acetylglucosaminyl-phosphatidylinositol de-N-acetylase [Xylographa carneopallida]|nr:N-acetylglucosaminyl-phosphatidylinositol de-N-acetylase [Xylographa carneopallida]
MQLYLALLIPVLILTCWLYTAHIARASFPRLRNQRICLLIAHPDDEAMFFAPTVLALADPHLGNHVKILCLSSGDADGLGPVRKTELARSALLLGLRSAHDVLVIEDPAFPDSMTTPWDAAQLATVMARTFQASSTKPPPARKQASSSSSSSSDQNAGAPTATIDVLITFDRHGVSRHPNHTSLYHGALAWLRGLMRGKAGWECPVALYTLSSTHVLRKYASVLDAPFTMLRCVLQSVAGAGKHEKGALPKRLMYLSDVGAYRTAQRAMTQAHRSQMRWFRWGWIAVGRYMVVNDLKRERVT